MVNQFDKNTILASVEVPINELLVFETIDSTNDFLLRQNLTPPVVVISEHQTHGRGRRNRNWQTPKGNAIAFSLSKRFEQPIDLNGFSLAIAVMVMRALAVPLQLKWPNDLLYQGKKIAGILVDVRHQHHHIDAVIGIGVNTQLSPSIDNATDLYSITGSTIDVNNLCAQLINHCLIGINEFANQGLESFLAEWSAHDYLTNHWITMTHHDTLLEGEYRGINDRGELQLQTDQGLLSIASGEVKNIKRSSKSAL